MKGEIFVKKKLLIAGAVLAVVLVAQVKEWACLRRVISNLVVTVRCPKR